MIEERADMLKTLAREDRLLREEASAHVQNGMDLLVRSKRLIQRLELGENDGEIVGIAVAEMMLSGNALRMALSAINSHHQRLEEAWVDHEGGISAVIRNGMEFENRVNEFLSLIRETAKERRRR